MPADAAAVGRGRQGPACGRFAMSQIAATTVSVPRISRLSNPRGDQLSCCSSGLLDPCGGSSSSMRWPGNAAQGKGEVVHGMRFLVGGRAMLRAVLPCTNMYLLPGCEAVQAAISMPTQPRPTPTSSSRFGRHRCGTTGSEFLSLSISSGCRHARLHPSPVPPMQPPVHCLPRRLWKVDALFLPLLSRAEGEQDGDQQAPR